MTPKEKAKELVNKYLNAPFNCKDCDMPYCDVRCTQLMESEAQECALIAVDEILKLDDIWHYYWQQVKEQIQEL
jgi:hypothetical protein